MERPAARPVPGAHSRARLRRVALVLLLAGAGAGVPASDVRLVLLGTAGGPTPKRTRAAPAQALQVGDAVYVVDCGNGVARQMALAGLRFVDLRHVFLTHHHSDHAADLVTLPLVAWAAGNDGPLTLHGPLPLRRSVKAGLRAHAFDLDLRRRDEGRAALRRRLQVHQFRGDGVVHRDARVTVRAARVEHPPIAESYAYRFDVGDRSVVISGDTAPAASLVRLARGADLLVHEVLLLDPQEVARWTDEPPDHPLVRHIVRSHTSYRDVGRIAGDAGVGRLVLSHFVPGDAPLDREAVLDAIRNDFAGDVVFGEDLMVLEIAD